MTNLELLKTMPAEQVVEIIRLDGVCHIRPLGKCPDCCQDCGITWLNQENTNDVCPWLSNWEPTKEENE